MKRNAIRELRRIRRLKRRKMGVECRNGRAECLGRRGQSSKQRNRRMIGQLHNGRKAAIRGLLTEPSGMSKRSKDRSKIDQLPDLDALSWRISVSTR